MTRLSSTDNHYRLAISEIRKLPRDKKLKILEIGAGAKIIADFLPKNITYHTMDNSGHFWKQEYTYNHNLNEEKMPIQNNSYDIIICNETLEHVLYPEKVLEEIKRIAKDDSIFFFSLPNEYNFILRLYYLFAIKTKTEEPFKVVEKALHIHKPTVQDILNLFAKHFRIRKVDYIWQSRMSEKSSFARGIDNLIRSLVRFYPSLFCRTVSVMVKNK